MNNPFEVALPTDNKFHRFHLSPTPVIQITMEYTLHFSMSTSRTRPIERSLCCSPSTFSFPQIHPPPLALWVPTYTSSTELIHLRWAYLYHGWLESSSSAARSDQHPPPHTRHVKGSLCVDLPKTRKRMRLRLTAHSNTAHQQATFSSLSSTLSSELRPLLELTVVRIPFPCDNGRMLFCTSGELGASGLPCG